MAVRLHGVELNQRGVARVIVWSRWVGRVTHHVPNVEAPFPIKRIAARGGVFSRKKQGTHVSEDGVHSGVVP